MAPLFLFGALSLSNLCLAHHPFYRSFLSSLFLSPASSLAFVPAEINKASEHRPQSGLPVDSFRAASCHHCYLSVIASMASGKAAALMNGGLTQGIM